MQDLINQEKTFNSIKLDINRFFIKLATN